MKNRSVVARIWGLGKSLTTKVQQEIFLGGRE